MGANTEKLFFRFALLWLTQGSYKKAGVSTDRALDLRITTLPTFPVYRIRFGRKCVKTAENGFSILHYFGSTRASLELKKIPPDRA